MIAATSMDFSPAFTASNTGAPAMPAVAPAGLNSAAGPTPIACPPRVCVIQITQRIGRCRRTALWTSFPKMGRLIEMNERPLVRSGKLALDS